MHKIPKNVRKREREQEKKKCAESGVENLKMKQTCVEVTDQRTSSTFLVANISSKTLLNIRRKIKQSTKGMIKNPKHNYLHIINDSLFIDHMYLKKAILKYKTLNY
jgi:hypothetical protein